ncbi:hypothetical protein EZ456_04345 [Pedobacter psychrodurus]|uniref:Protein kinase domain-containing protein n=1 Tax=Pedobacter psychrodurus TaxID=2530456 RepID=A0A4R0Q6Y5_9SPHI|nr:protein kinase [Pedobacter psychrodurus]TCD28625.1 hypothetical protein EZ456_04345 [Pedobacter psychrodurus]
MERSSSTISIIPVTDYSRLLKRMGISYLTDGYYLVHGEIGSSGWKRIYLSVVISQVPGLFAFLIPKLVSMGIAFAVVRDERSAAMVLNGAAGAAHVGKVVILEVPEDVEALVLRLAPLMEGFHGPAVPGKRLLSKNIYADNIGTAGPKHPFSMVQVLAGKYIVIALLKDDPKGEVLKALFVGRSCLPKWCLIKEGRRFMISDAAGQDMGDRLRWQKQIFDRFSGTFPMPAVFDLFSENGNSYLVMEWIKGKNIGKIIDGIYKGRDWTGLTVKEKKFLMGVLMEVINIVGRVHANGFLHRDLSTANFLVTKKMEIYLIDWELAFDVKMQFPLPPFGFGTPGFISPEQNLGEIPSAGQDIYSVCALMVVFFTGIRPVDLSLKERRDMEGYINGKTGEPDVAQIVSRGLERQPEKRPELDEIREMVLELIGRFGAGINKF